MHLITRKHEFCYGHRVVGHEGKCCHLHGHNAVVEFTCEADTLDDLGRVVDFGVLKTTLCMWLESQWDHRMLLWHRDPLLAPLRDLDPAGVVAVPFNPTAENMARHLVDVVALDLLADTGARLVLCTLHETGKCSATYSVKT